MSNDLVRVAINGFGRMGRLGLRAGWDGAVEAGYEIVRVNELHGTAETAAHLLEYDSVHGRWLPEGGEGAGEISHGDDFLMIGGKKVEFTQVARPEESDWAGVDVVIDATGAFRTREVLEPYFAAGVKKVVVAAPVKEGALNVVMGCNDDLYDAAEHDLVTAASCTTNCIAPVIKVMKEKLGIVHGMITTLHDVTNTQVVVDKPHKDLRRARSCLNSLIPTSTGSATAITMIYPELKGKLDGVAVRIPLLNASLTDVVLEVARETSVEEVNGFLKEAAEGELAGILGFEMKPLVSADYVNDERSGVVDGLSTMVTDGTQVKLLVWYDNEVGYATRMMELVSKVVGLM